MSALMWYCAVPAGYHADASSPPIVRHGYSAPRWPTSRGPPSGGAEHPAAEAEQRPRPRRVRVDEERDDVDLGVPEVVAVIAAPGDALCRDTEALRTGGRLHERKEAEPHGLLE